MGQRERRGSLSRNTRVNARTQLSTYLGNQKSQHSTMTDTNSSSSSADGRSSKHIFVTGIKTDPKFQKLA